MAKIEIELSDATLENLMRLANERHETVSKVIEEQLSQTVPATTIPGWGLLADEPEIADAILQSMREIRGQTEFRRSNG
jgi:predicted transcriptional regulator